MSIQVKVSRPKRGLAGPYRFKTIAAAWGAEVTPIVERALKAKAPVAKENGGRLRESIRHKQANAAGLTVTFYTEVPYAKFVLDGTREHQIRPRTGRALHWKGANGDVFAQVVNHPGTKANKFPERAIKPLLPALKGRFRQISIEALGGE